MPQKRPPREPSAPIVSHLIEDHGQDADLVREQSMSANIDLHDALHGQAPAR
jgi:hypothetical protein